jgi:hypothetical protein
MYNTPLKITTDEAININHENNSVEKPKTHSSNEEQNENKKQETFLTTTTALNNALTSFEFFIATEPACFVQLQKDFKLLFSNVFSQFFIILFIIHKFICLLLSLLSSNYFLLKILNLLKY